MRRRVGKTRYKLAEMLCRLTGWIVEAHHIHQNNPIHCHFEDCCLWDCWAIIPAKDGNPMRGHIYSWDRMKDCVKFGIEKCEHSEPRDIEIAHK